MYAEGSSESEVLTRGRGRQQRLSSHASRTAKGSIVSTQEIVRGGLLQWGQPHLCDEFRIFSVLREIDHRTVSCRTNINDPNWDGAHTESGNLTLTSDIKDRVILAHIHIRQLSAGCELFGDIRVFQKLEAFIVFEVLSGASYIVNHGSRINHRKPKPERGRARCVEEKTDLNARLTDRRVRTLGGNEINVEASFGKRIVGLDQP